MSEMNGLLIPAYVENVSTRKDRTVKIVLSTQELSPYQAGQIFSFMNKLTATYFSEKDINRDEIEFVDQVNPDLPGKSQSQRIRSVLYLLFQENNEEFKDFASYYQNKTEKYIEHLKSKLP
jgi:hypothetical protein